MNIKAIARTRIPNATLKLLLRAAKTVVQHELELSSDSVQAAQKALIAYIETIDDAVDARLRSKNPGLVALELDFDRAVDSHWVFLRTLFELCMQAFGHAGLDKLSPERQAEVQLPLLRTLAKKATALHEQLFAAEGTQFVSASFPEQAESMASLLRVIKDDGLDQDIELIGGKLLLRTLRVSQEEYEQMVNERLKRELGVASNLRDMRDELRWRLDRYKVAVELLYDPEAPESLAVVEQALRPLLLLSAHMNRGGSSTELDEELDAALVEAELFNALEELAASEGSELEPEPAPEPAPESEPAPELNDVAE